MKKVFTLLAVALVFATISAKAQIQKGNLLVGGNIANIGMGLDNGGIFSIDINPKVGVFVKNNLALGAYFNLDLSTAKGAGTNVGYGIGGLGRYYVNDTAINLLRHGRFFVEATVGIEGDNPSRGDNTNGLGVGAGPGYAYFITPNVGLEALLKYDVIAGFGSKTTSNNLNFSFGFQIYLPSRKLATTIRNM